MVKKITRRNESPIVKKLKVLRLFVSLNVRAINTNGNTTGNYKQINFLENTRNKRIMQLCLSLYEDLAVDYN